MRDTLMLPTRKRLTQALKHLDGKQLQEAQRIEP